MSVKKPLRYIALLSVVAMLAAMGFVAAAQVADVSILPMPSETEMVDKVAETEAEAVEQPQVADGGAIDDVVASESDAEAEVNEAAESSETAEQQPEVGVEADPSEEQVTLPDVEPVWTEEEILALRQLARERIAAQEMMNHVSEYLRDLWDGEVSPWLDELEERATEEVPSKDEVLGSVDTWLEERNLPERDRLIERWNEIMEHITQSTGIAMDDAKEIGRDWIEAQRELIDDVIEDVKELRQEMRSAVEKTEDGDDAPRA